MKEASSNPQRHPDLSRVEAQQREAAEKARHPSRVVRRRRWQRRTRSVITTEVMEKGLGFTLGWQRTRHGWSAAQVARRAGLSPQTVLDLERGVFTRFAWENAYKVCEVLGLELWQAEKMTWLWLMHDLRVEHAHHHAERGWAYFWPWSRKRTSLPVRRRKR